MNAKVPTTLDLQRRLKPGSLYRRMGEGGRASSSNDIRSPKEIETIHVLRGLGHNQSSNDIRSPKEIETAKVLERGKQQAARSNDIRSPKEIETLFH
jgi:hypothetical protein